MRVLEPGARIGDLRVERELGRGAFARVYLAEDTLIRRHVALKLVDARAEATEDEQGRVLREARVLGQLNHPNIVTLLRVHPPHELGFWAFEFEYVEGGSLAQRLDAGAEFAADALPSLARNLADALAAAHAAGVIHGDVKAGNVLLTRDGQAKLADFGLARLALEGSLDTRSGDGIAGTPHYMAPEVILGDAPAAPADVWSLGVLLYRLLEERLPFTGATLESLFYAIQARPAVLRHTVRAPWLAPLVERCLNRDPAARPSASELADACRNTDGMDAPRARPASLPATPGLFGRDLERRIVADLIDEASRGTGHTLLVRGPEGIGKSALLGMASEFGRRRDMRWVQARLTRQEGLLRPLLAGVRRATKDPAIRHETPSSSSAIDMIGNWLESGTVLRGADAAQPVWALEQVLGGLAGNRRIAVCLDDAHVVDPDDLEVLRHLSRKLPAVGSLLVLGCQTFAERIDREIAGMPEVTTIDLSPLDRDASYRLLCDRARSEIVDPAVSDRILGLAQGNPLFVIELLRHLSDLGAVVAEDGRLQPGPRWSDSPLPRQFHDLVEMRVAGLDDADREILDVAAVDGTKFDGDAVAAVLDRPVLDVLRALQRIAYRRGVVVPSPSGYQFSNAVFREAIYERLAPELRTRIHGVLAEHLNARAAAQPVDAARRGLHWERAGRLDRARPLLLEAALVAGNRQQYRRTIELCRRAGLWPRPDDIVENAEVLIHLAMAFRDTGDTDAAEAVYAALRRVAEERDDRFLLLRVEARLARSRFYSLGRESADEELLAEAVRELPDSRERGSAAYMLGVIAKFDGRVDVAERRFHEADELFLAAECGAGHSDALDQLGAIARSRGRLEEAEELFAAAASSSREAGCLMNAAISEVNQALTAFERGDIAVRPVLDRAIRTLELEGARNAAAQAATVLAHVDYAHGEVDAAERNLERARNLIRGEYLPALTGLRLFEAELASIRGDVATALRVLDDCEELARRSGKLSHRVLVDVFRAQALAFTGDAGGAARAATRAQEVLSQGGPNSDAVVRLAESTLYGMPVDCLDRLPGDAGLSAPAKAFVDACRAMADPGSGAERIEAAAILLASPTIGERRALLRAMAAWFHGVAQAALGDVEAARAHLDEARSRARGLGHVWLERRVAGTAEG